MPATSLSIATKGNHLVIPTATSPSAGFISVSIATWSQRFALPINYYATYPPSNINVSPVLMDERR
ncbi:MAG: hypothetical protein F6K28_01285 [Microcoleus sp. SIO2G3]|nr:hypothetical protein [Microcoleus sp. SIO2G3]